MKKDNILLSVVLICLLGCVQKTHKRTVVFKLTTRGIPAIQTVGLRGEGRPFSWDKDLEMIPVVKDSLYSATVTTETGYLFTEIKFTINGVLELENANNRKVVFSKGDTTFYNGVFNQQPETNNQH